MSTAIQADPVANVLERLDGVRKTASGWEARCPSHDDRKASLCIGVGDDGRVLLTCQAGCSTEDVVASLGMTMRSLFAPNNGNGAPMGKSKSNAGGKFQIEKTYDYLDEKGTLLFQVVRLRPKDFRQRRPDGKGGWTWGTKGIRQVLRKLPELVAANKERVVCLCEGERDDETLEKHGFLATTNPGGAGKWRPEYAEFLRGRKVVIFHDNDDPGRKHADQVARSLHGVAQSIRVANLPGLPEKGDVSDWFSSGGTSEELKRLVSETPDWTPTAAEWPELEPFDRPDLPPFPVDALPEPLREWVRAESLAMQVPADLPGLVAMAVCSATVARKVEVEARPGWREPVNLFVSALLPPGNRKSGVFTDGVRPLREIESELVERERPTVAQAQSDRRRKEARLRKMEKLAAEKLDAEAAQQADDLAKELAEEPEVSLPRLLVDDSTPEKLGKMMAEQGGRIASMSPEGGIWDVLRGLYNHSGISNFTTFLLAHAGDDIVTDRISRASVRVERPALTCCYVMQPAVIAGLSDTAFRARGLLARFLYAAPASWIGTRLVAPPSVPEAVAEAYRATVRQLAANLEGLSEETLPVMLRLSHHAGGLLIAWETEIEEMLADGGKMEAMRDWGSKLAGLTLRLAGTMHCVARWPSEEIDTDTLAAAIQIGRYAIPHAEAVFRLMEAQDETSDDDARYLWRWVEKNGLETFTRREAHRHGHARFKKAEDLDSPLGELVRRGYIRQRPTPSTGGRPASPVYEVNPAALKTNTPKTGDRSDKRGSEVMAGGASVTSVTGSEGIENQNWEDLVI